MKHLKPVCVCTRLTAMLEQSEGGTGLFNIFFFIFDHSILNLSTLRKMLPYFLKRKM